MDEALGTPPRTAIARILVVDDDRELTDLLHRYLGKENFAVESAENGEEGLACLATRDVDLVILDVMLPGINGIEVLRRIRAKSEIPVLMLTARSEDLDRIVGLEVGSDDYLGKPFNPRELLARIHAILRRTTLSGRAENGPGRPEQISVGDVRVDLGTRSVTRADEPVEFTTVEFDLLVALLRCAGNVLSREEISRKVFDRALTPLDRSIDMHICQLRKKLGDLPGARERIVTVRGVGYLYSCSGTDFAARPGDSITRPFRIV